MGPPPSPNPTVLCGPRRQTVLRLSWHWAVPQRAGLLTKREKRLLSSLMYVIYSKRSVFTPFFPEEGHLVLIPFIISVSLLKRHCSVLVFIMGASRGLPCPSPAAPHSPLLSLLLPFTVFIKHQLTSLFSPLSPPSEVYCPLFFLKPRRQDAWSESGEGQKRPPRAFCRAE